MTDHLHRTETWDDVAGWYQELAEPFTRQYALAALDFAGGASPGERVLDVAAGPGTFSLPAARAGARVLATDFSAGMVQRLDARLREEGLDVAGSEARVMDGQALDLPDAGFDAAFSIFGVMLFPDYAAGLREMHRVVRPGGRVVVASWLSDTGAGPMALFSEAYRSTFPDREGVSIPGIKALNTPEGASREMREAGSSTVETTIITGAWTAPSAAWLIENVDRLYRFSPQWGALDDDERSRLLKALETVCARHGEEELRVEAEALVALGTR